MLVPVSWLKDYVDIDVPIEWLAERLTLAGVEVTHIRYIGIPQGKVEGVRWPQSDHLIWDREKILLGAIREVKPHPDADRLVLAMVDYGGDELEQCVTGAPNLFPYKGQGELETPLWSAFAMEGSTVWDGHSDKPKLMKLKGKKLRGIYNKSMVCSEKELGISEEHEGVLILDGDESYVPGTPFQDILGDVVLEVDLTPNLARCFSMIGVAREVAALLDKPLNYPSFEIEAEGDPIEGTAMLDIREPSLNPRFTLTLLRDTTVTKSPFWMQHRLKLVGQRPINNIVDVTNYVTFEIGQPLHAFDYDKLAGRVNGKPPTIITRLPEKGEVLATLDGENRKLDDFSILVADTAGVIGLGGVMGGADTEIDDNTTNVLLEAAAWNFINIRKTIKSQKLFTEASARFSRGVHPSQAILGNQRGIILMHQTGGGQIADGIIDEYPAPPDEVTVEIPVSEVQRIMGIEFDRQTAADILTRLYFDVTIAGDTLHVVVPDHRMDIGTGVVGQADLIEEIARIYGYDKIPNTIMADEMPPQRMNANLEYEERTRDLLVALGLCENISYRFTTPEFEAMLVPTGMSSSLPTAGYVEMANPSSMDKTVLRHTILISLLENTARNARYNLRQQVFEIGNVYLKYNESLPKEVRHLGILMSGPRQLTDWTSGENGDLVDFFDMKGVVEGLLEGLHIEDADFSRSEHTTFHPGRSATLRVGGKEVGTFGELHPLVASQFKLTEAPILIAEFDLDTLLAAAPSRHAVESLPVTPAILEDIALVVRDSVHASEVEAVIRQAGGRLLKDVELFDVYRGDPIPASHKSLAYSLTFQTDDKTLTDKDAAKVRKKIIGAAKHKLNAELRS